MPPSELEDDAGAFEIQAIEKSGALVHRIVWTVAENSVDDRGRRHGPAGPCFIMARHHTGSATRELPLQKAFDSSLVKQIPEQRHETWHPTCVVYTERGGIRTCLAKRLTRQYRNQKCLWIFQRPPTWRASLCGISAESSKKTPS